MILDITIMYKFNDRDFRNEPIQFKENIEESDLKDEVEKIIHSQISQGEYNELIKTKFLNTESKELTATFRIL